MIHATEIEIPHLFLWSCTKIFFRQTLFSTFQTKQFFSHFHSVNKVSQTYSSFEKDEWLSFHIFIYWWVKLQTCLPAVDLEELFKGFNIYRNSQDRSVLTQNSKAKCIAEQIAKNWYNQLPCSRAINGDALLPSNQSQLPLFTQYSRKCKVNLNHTVDGIILPVYVPNSAEKLMLTNCTHSQAPKYLGNATYTRVGLATNEDCLVIALGTDAIGGSYSAGVFLVPNIGWVYWLGLLFLGSIFCFREGKKLLFSFIL